eukprot:TRINITY_DN26481_c0_g1_i1.p1 TRINITY_DN26481_c0_g1~~TRINITY_DN26481_c0_g1_i1.p1  ORF type:complete len:131 (-),score=11.65 TRINITY_DN26481_c0_g1_i1:179-571(-)
MNLKRKTREEVTKYIKHQDFNEERANKASKVAGPLVNWIKSQVKYSELCDVVRPMQKEIKTLKKRLEKKKKQRTLCIEVVSNLEVKIIEIKTEINEMVDGMIRMQDDYDFKDDPLMNIAQGIGLYKNISL